MKNAWDKLWSSGAGFRSVRLAFVAVILGGSTLLAFQNCGSAAGFKISASAGAGFCLENPTDAACVTGASVSCSFNGQAVAEGATVTAYLTSTGASCLSQQRTCTKGALSGNFAFASCQPNVAASCLFNGVTVPNGGTVTAYLAASGSPTCQSQTRTCANGVLSGTYAYGACQVGAYASCLFNGQTIPHGQSVTAYVASTVPAGQTCQSEVRTCFNGSLSGSATAGSCVVGAALGCSFNGQTIASGQSVTAYVASTVPAGQSCSPQTRTCSNGSLSGTATFASCAVSAPQACTLGGQTITSGSSITAYYSSTATVDNHCASEVRSCSNGTLSGSATSLTCAEPAEGMELVSDRQIGTGFVLTDPCPDPSTNVGTGSCSNFVNHNVSNPLHPELAATAPKWTLQQWGSRTGLSTVPQAYGDGVAWQNAEKHLAIFPENIYEMGVDGNADFQGVVRQVSGRQGWPSLYLGKPISPVGNPSIGSGPLSTIKAMSFSMDAFLTDYQGTTGAGYDPNQNAISFVVYISLQNLNPAAAGFGQYINLGVPIYNNFEAFPSHYDAADNYQDGLGTGTEIYSIAYSNFASVSVQSGQRVHMSGNIWSGAMEAFQAALRKNLVSNPDLSNYYVSGFIIGWEVTGLQRATVQFSMPSILVKH